MKCKLISIDLSTVATGVAYFENAVYKKHFLIKPKKSLETEDRTEEIIKTLNSLFKEYSPDIVVIEDTFASINMMTYKWLTRLQGAIIMCCLERDAEYHLMLPSEWRKLIGFVQGKKTTKELKQMSKAYVLEKYNLDVTDDEADSICIGEAYIKSWQK